MSADVNTDGQKYVYFTTETPDNCASYRRARIQKLVGRLDKFFLR